MRKLPALALAICAVPGMLCATASTAAAATHTCPSQYTCVYSGTTTSTPITYSWKTYGPHNIYGQNGDHLVVNAQTGGAFAAAYSQFGGHGTRLWILEDGQSGRPPRSAVKNLGPVYSFQLYAAASCYPRCS
jgi:hypothetical protein